MCFLPNCIFCLFLSSEFSSLLVKAKYQTQIVHIQPKSSAPKNKFTKMLNITRNSFLWGPKLINPNLLKQKRQNLVIFWD